MPGLFVKRDCAWSSSICDKSGRFLWYFFWNSLSLKLSMPGVAGFLLLLGAEVPSLGLVTNLGLWQKSKGFESRALVTEGTRTGFAMLVLSKLMWLDLSKLCARLCILEKMEEKHILFCESNIFENSAFAVWIQVPRDTSWNLVGNYQNLQSFWNATEFNCHLLESFTVRDCMSAYLLRAPGRYSAVIVIPLSSKYYQISLLICTIIDFK